MRNRFTKALSLALLAAGLAQASHTILPADKAASSPSNRATLGDPVPEDGVPSYSIETRSPYSPGTNAASPTASNGNLTPVPAADPSGHEAPPAPATGLLNAPQPGAFAPDSQTWFRADYLLWHISDSRLPPLAGMAARSFADASELPEGAITPVLGGKTSFDTHSGVRLDGGLWFGGQQCVGLDAGYFQLEHRTLGFGLTSAGDPIVGPVFNDLSSQRLILIEAGFPGSVSRNEPQRTATMTAGTDERLWSVEANLRVRGPSVFSDRTDLLFGFRHINFDEGVGVNTVSVIDPTVPVTGGSILATGDSFRAHNRFYGGQIGFQSDYRWRRVFWNFVGKLGIGGMHENVNIQGATASITPAGAITAGPGGVLTQPTNIGQHNNSIFTVVPEIDLNIGYQVTPRLRAYIGYTFLYIDHLARIGDQIDFNVDRTQVQALSDFNPSAPARHPVAVINDNFMWAYGLNFGLDFRF